MEAEKKDDHTISELVKEVIKRHGNGSKDLERLSWNAVHNYMHGFYPVEYDIREISESLYLAVLNESKEKIFK